MVRSPGWRTVSTMRHALAVGALLLAGIAQAQTGAIRLRVDFPADGATLFLSHDPTISILPLVTRNPGVNPARGFVAAAGFATFVNTSAGSGGTPLRSMSEYVAWVRSQGGKGNVGVPAPTPVPEFLLRLIGQKYALRLQAHAKTWVHIIKASGFQAQ